MSAENRTTIFRSKKNRFEHVEVSHEIHIKTPLVSVRSYRGENFTGKGISLQPELFELLLPEITKAIQSLRLELAANGEAAVPNVVAGKAKRGRKQVGRMDAETNCIDVDEIDRQALAKIAEINADTSLTPQQKQAKLMAVSEWAYRLADGL